MKVSRRQLAEWLPKAASLLFAAGLALLAIDLVAFYKSGVADILAFGEFLTRPMSGGAMLLSCA